VGKASARQKWQRHGLDDLAEQIISHVNTLKGTEQWTSGFEPAPLTYLNQRRWEDQENAPGAILQRRVLTPYPTFQNAATGFFDPLPGILKSRET